MTNSAKRSRGTEALGPIQAERNAKRTSDKVVSNVATPRVEALRKRAKSPVNAKLPSRDYIVAGHRDLAQIIRDDVIDLSKASAFYRKKAKAIEIATEMVGCIGQDCYILKEDFRSFFFTQLAMRLQHDPRPVPDAVADALLGLASDWVETSSDQDRVKFAENRAERQLSKDSRRTADGWRDFLKRAGAATAAKNKPKKQVDEAWRQTADAWRAFIHRGNPGHEGWSYKAETDGRLVLSKTSETDDTPTTALL